GYGNTSNEYDELTGDVSLAASSLEPSDPNNGTDPLLEPSAPNDGADTFVLGDILAVFYQDAGYATITDFDWTEGDKIQVHGDVNDYSLGFQNWSGDVADDTLIYYQDDLIGVVQDTTDVIIAQDFVTV
ncbi:MAG: hypothetical protein AAGA01_08230, partial [Cyanobacteria bacterium P01_E01_bin.43]